MRPRALLGVVALVGVAGCFKLTAPPPAIQEYRLEYPPPSISGQPLPVVLDIAPFGSAAAYNRAAIVYRTSAYEMGTYFYERWITYPANMITDLLARDFTRSGFYRAVQQGASALPSDYSLSGEVDEIEERDYSKGCSAHLELQVLLFRSRPLLRPRVVLQKAYSADEPCSESTAEGFVAAMSKALESISAQVQRDVYAAIVQDRSS